MLRSEVFTKKKSSKHEQENELVVNSDLDEKLLCDRKLVLHKSLEDDVVKLIMQIEQWNAEDDEVELALKEYTRPTIFLFVHTPGGLCDAGLALVSALEQSVTPVTTIAVGSVASMGIAIFLAGSERYAYRHSIFMIHQLSSGAIGKLQGQLEHVSWNLRMQARMDTLITERSIVTQEQLDSNRERKQDWYMFAEEARDLGMVDAVLAVGVQLPFNPKEAEVFDTGTTVEEQASDDNGTTEEGLDTVLPADEDDSIQPEEEGSDC
jgi:ATP-dependent Clp protease protease subunit